MQLRRGPRLFRRDTNYRRLLRAGVAYSLASSCVVPFIVPYALKHAGIASSALGVFIVARQLAFSLFALIWGRISDRHGNRRVLVMGSALSLLVPLAMLAAPLIKPGAELHLGTLVVQLPVAYYAVVFGLVGLITGGLEMAYSNYLMEVAPARKRPTYLGFRSTLGVPLAWAPFVASLLIGAQDRFAVGFVLSLAAALVALVNALRLGEVRQSDAEQPGTDGSQIQS